MAVAVHLMHRAHTDSVVVKRSIENIIQQDFGIRVNTVLQHVIDRTLTQDVLDRHFYMDWQGDNPDFAPIFSYAMSFEENIKKFVVKVKDAMLEGKNVDQETKEGLENFMIQLSRDISGHIEEFQIDVKAAFGGLLDIVYGNPAAEPTKTIPGTESASKKLAEKYSKELIAVATKSFKRLLAYLNHFIPNKKRENFGLSPEMIEQLVLSFIADQKASDNVQLIKQKAPPRKAK